MKRTLQVVGWFFFALDGVALLSLLNWALTASSREGESAYAIVFSLFMLAWVGLGGGALVVSARLRSALGLWCSTLFLGLPPLLAVALRILNSL